MITVVSWSIAQQLQAVSELLAMEANVALMQEVGVGALELLATAGGNVAMSLAEFLGTLARGGGTAPLGRWW